MPTAKAALADFVGLLTDGAPDGAVEVRCLNQQAGQKPYGDRWFGVRDRVGIAHAVLELDQNPNALTCIAPAIRPSEGLRGPESILTTLWSDIDFKGFQDGEDGAKRALLGLLAPKPHAIVRSGHGFHAYWKLKEPFDATLPAGIVRATDVLRRIARSVGGDLAPAQPAAVLRAPDTWNRKGEPPVQAMISLWRPGLPEVQMSDFEALPATDRRGPIALPGGDGVAAAGAPIVLEQLTIPRTIRDVIRFGTPEGADESSAAQSVITSLLRAGYEPPLIFQLFRQTPKGIGHSWHKRGRDGDRWLGLSISNAQERVPHSRPWAPEGITEAMERDVEEPSMLIPGLLRDGQMSSFVADAGVGKSWLADIIGFHLATGIALWGRPLGPPKRVLVIQEEMPDVDVIGRLRKIRKTLPIDNAALTKAVFHHVYQTGFELANFRPLVKALEEQPYDIVFIDSLAATSGQINTDVDNNGTQQMMQALKREIAIQYHCHIIIIHHTKKLDDGRFNMRHAYRGVSSFKGILDNMWVLEKKSEEEGGWIQLHVAKARGFKEPEGVLALRIVDTDNGGVTISLATNHHISG